jgi:tetratricopeptide (TPR) repeat protein
MLADLGVRLDEALGYIQKAVDLDPYNGAFLDSLGWVYFKQNRLEEAEENLIKAARINDSDPVIYEHLGDLYVQLGTLDKARYFYEKSMAHAENEEESERVKEKLTQLKSSIDG